MGISHETPSEVESSVGLSSTQGQRVAPEEADQTLHLLRQFPVLEREEQQIDQRRANADPREQILALYDEYRPRLFRYIRSMNLDREQAEEVIQETFMRLTTQLLQRVDIENVQGWVVRVAHNLTVDALKRNDRDAARTFETPFVLENRVDPTPNPEEAYSKKEQIRRMEIALSTLSPQQRQCFSLRAEGFRYKDIGLALGISEQRAAFVLKQVAVRLAAICG
jgi:RNA polymerase sigma-70 factor (ECF subfamily)